MPQCLICQTRYSAHKTDRCSLCGWDVQSISFVSGLLPEVVQKEAVRLEWGKQLWSKVKQRHEETHQFQIQLKNALDRQQQLEIQLEKAHRENAALIETLQHQETLIHLLRSASETIDSPTASSPVSDPIDPALVAEVSASDVVSAIDSATLNNIEFKQVLLTANGRETQFDRVPYFQQRLSDDSNLDMILVPGGRFWMGSPDSEIGRSSNESPRHDVRVPPFCMSRFPITQAQWKAVSALPKINRSLSLCPANFEGDDRPVEQVTWYDAVEFCARLSDQTGRFYRLPSEAEWEYACRARTQTPFHFGDTIAPDLANYDGSYTYSFEPRGEYRHETTPVAAFGVANGFGLCDLHGNVWEWCADAWHPNYEGAPIEGSAWQDDGASYRVLRGGAWYCLPELCRSAQRHWNQPDMGGSGIGFRVVCAATLI